MVTEFLILEFSKMPQLRVPLLLIFLCLYMAAVSGNLLIIVTISASPTLHTPMYFFPVNLAMADLLCTSTILPKLLDIMMAIRASPTLHTPMYFFLVNLAVADPLCTSTILPKLLDIMMAGRTISFGGCMAQVFFTWSLGAEVLLFSAMAYDCFVAICHPLHYSVWMGPRVCAFLAANVWAISLLNISINTGLMLRLSFCNSNVIEHTFCEIPPLLKLSSAPTQLNEAMYFAADVFFAAVNFSVTILSYGFIVASILSIRSAEGKRRAFSTCSAHLIVVTMYYSTVIYTYIRPASSYSLNKNKVVSIIYTSVAPTLNAIIYTLRNKDVQAALQRLLPVPAPLCSAR